MGSIPHDLIEDALVIGGIECEMTVQHQSHTDDKKDAANNQDRPPFFLFKGGFDGSDVLKIDHRTLPNNESPKSYQS